MNELRYLGIADESLRNGTLWAFTNHGVPYADKPPLYMWCLMLCRLIAGKHVGWLLILIFSVLPAIGIVVVMNRWSSTALSARWRGMASLMLLSTGLFATSAAILRMDMLMCLFCVLSLYVFWKMLCEPDVRYNKWRWLFPTYLFLGLFTKGPLAILIPMCASVVFLAVSGRLRLILRFWGWTTWLVLLIGCGIWFGCVYTEAGADYLNNLVFHQTLDRAVNAFHHKAPFYYYAVSSLYSLAPWTLLILGAIVTQLYRHRHSHTEWNLGSFFLVTAVSTLVLLSCLSSKIQIYFLPAVPFLIYYAVMVVADRAGTMWQRISLGVPALAFVGILPVLIMVGWDDMPFMRLTYTFAAGAILSAGGCISLLFIIKGASSGCVLWSVRALGWAMLAAVFTGGYAMPDMNPYIGYGSVCERASEIASEYGNVRFGSWRVSRPENMDVYLGKEIVILPDDSIPNISREDVPFVIITRGRYIDEIPSGVKYKVGPYGIIVFD